MLINWSYSFYFFLFYFVIVLQPRSLETELSKAHLNCFRFALYTNTKDNNYSLNNYY